VATALVGRLVGLRREAVAEDGSCGLAFGRGRVDRDEATRGDDAAALVVDRVRRLAGGVADGEADLVAAADVHAADGVDHALADARADPSALLDAEALVAGERLEHRDAPFGAEVLVVERLTGSRERPETARDRAHDAFVAGERLAGVAVVPLHRRAAGRVHRGLQTGVGELYCERRAQPWLTKTKVISIPPTHRG
jgi:hypothetical protein